MDKEWCSKNRRHLRDSKRYLKTEFRFHYKGFESTCADHCCTSVLSNEDDPSFLQQCKHQYFTDCEDCQSLKITLKELEDALKRTSWIPHSKDHQQDLIYDFECAQNDISSGKHTY